MARNAVLITLVGLALIGGMGEFSSAYAQANGGGKIAEFGKDLTDTSSSFGGKILGVLFLVLTIACVWACIRGLKEGTETGGWGKFLSFGAMAVLSFLFFIFILNAGGHNPDAIMREFEIK